MNMHPPVFRGFAESSQYLQLSIYFAFYWPPPMATASVLQKLLFRPPDIVVGGLRFYHGFFFLTFFLSSSATFRARWTELNQNRLHARKWVRFENACPKPGVSHPPTNRGPKNHIFSTTLQLKGNFNGLYLRNKTRYKQSGKCVGN